MSSLPFEALCPLPLPLSLTIHSFMPMRLWFTGVEDTSVYNIQ